jgi:prevent-host-death family protein
MIRKVSVNIADAKARLPKLVERAASGEEIVIARNGIPRARLVPLAGTGPRLPGHGEGQWQLDADFNEPPPAEIQQLFEDGRD